MDVLLSSFVHQKPGIKNTIWYNGHSFSLLTTGEQTAMAFSLIYCHFRKGGEPPPHLHEKEDESYFILEGVIKFHVGSKTFLAKAGELVVLTKGFPHHHSIETETAKALLFFTPAGFENYFLEFGKPAESMNLPPSSREAPTRDDFQRMAKRALDFGIKWTPEF